MMTDGGAGIFAEPGFVSVSEDGELFTQFPCEPESPERRGCAGVAPVFARKEIEPSVCCEPNQASIPLNEQAVGSALEGFGRIDVAAFGGDEPRADRMIFEFC